MFDQLATAKGQRKPQELWISPLEFDRSLSDFEIACPQSTALCRVCLSVSAAQENRNHQMIGTFGARLNWRSANILLLSLALRCFVAVGKRQCDFLFHTQMKAPNTKLVTCESFACSGLSDAVAIFLAPFLTTNGGCTGAIRHQRERPP